MLNSFINSELFWQLSILKAILTKNWSYPPKTTRKFLFLPRNDIWCVNKSFKKWFFSAKINTCVHQEFSRLANRQFQLLLEHNLRFLQDFLRFSDSSLTLQLASSCSEFRLRLWFKVPICVFQEPKGSMYVVLKILFRVQ